MHWHEYPILRILIPFIFGLLIEYFLPDLFSSALLLLLLSISSVALIAFIFNKFITYKNRLLSGFIYSIAFILLGISTTEIYLSRYNKSEINNLINKSDYVLVKNTDIAEETKNSIKINAEVINYIDSNRNYLHKNTRVILYFQKDSSSKNIGFGDIILIKNRLSETTPPKNPNEFNYKKYLAKKNIHHQAYLRSSDYKIITRNNSGFGLKKMGINVRNRIIANLQKNGVKGDEFAVAAALLLGQKDFLSKELQNTYARVGAMHILCVSGLHVGIIYMIMSLALKPLIKRKYGKLIKLIIIIASLWFYAIITGLSPSVMRASTMFSFIAVGNNLNRKIHIYNSLGASALVLLFFNPLLIFELGFQLSYAAVISIVSLQPTLYNTIYFKHWLPDKIWALICVSISAQLGTFAITLFYFNQFPNYFIITNLIVIPMAFIVLYTGIGFVVVSFIPYISSLVGKLLSLEIITMNFLLGTIESLPGAISKNININTFQFIVLILITITLIYSLVNKKKKVQFAFISLLILFSSSFFYNFYKISRNKKIVFYSLNKGLAFSAIDGKNHNFYKDGETLKSKEDYEFQTKGFWIKNNISNANIIDFNDNNIDSRFFKFGNTNIVILDSLLSSYKSKIKFNTDYLIIGNDKIYNYKSILENYYTKNIIFSPKTNYYLKSKITEYAKINNIKIYDLSDKYLEINE